jgi:hypothetical protein
MYLLLLAHSKALTDFLETLVSLYKKVQPIGWTFKLKRWFSLFHSASQRFRLILVLDNLNSSVFRFPSAVALLS